MSESQRLAKLVKNRRKRSSVTEARVVGSTPPPEERKIARVALTPEPEPDPEWTDGAALQPLRAPTGWTLAEESRKGQNPASIAVPQWIACPTKFDDDVKGEAGEAVGAFKDAGICPPIIAALNHHNISSLFPVQAAVIPTVLTARNLPYHPGDICVSAPTGSGKTLAYVIPIIQSLMNRVTRLPRALVVLPNRDLVQQVWGIFETYSLATARMTRGTNSSLRFERARLQAVALGSGNASFSKEQTSLVRKIGDCTQYQSLADVIITTPGRLVGHLERTEGLTLEHLEFLVVDEADRLLAQSYQDWLPLVLKKALRSALPTDHSLITTDMGACTFRDSQLVSTASGTAKVHSQLQKLLFSATLTHDPEQLASMNLTHPRLFIADGVTRRAAEAGRNPALRKQVEVHVTPATLSEHIIVCGAAHKPLVLVHFVLTRGFRRTIVFTSSIQATHRLCLLLRAFGGIEVAEFSSMLTSAERRRIIAQFNAGKVQLLVCSDAMGRGLDLEDVENVVNYEPPTQPKTYIHRVGRTARAGTDGAAFTILRRQEVLHFKELRNQVDSREPSIVRLTEDDYKPFEARYAEALRVLKELVRNEKKPLPPKKKVAS